MNYKPDLRHEKTSEDSNSPKKIDIGLGTGPDVLSMLAQLKENNQRRSHLNQPNMTVDYTNKRGNFRSLGMDANIREEDETYETEFSLANSK